MRRLFSTYAHGSAAVGLLLIRLVVGVALLVPAAVALRAGQGPGPGLLQGLATGLGILLLAGLWTPIAGALVGLYAIGGAILQPADRWHGLMVGLLGLALALLGPGAFSVDARLFGWKRLEIRDPNGPDR